MRRIAIVFAVTAAVMAFVFSGADWYARNSALPRYCAAPERTLSLVREILTLEDPGAGAEKRPYVVAAKLIFLAPRRDGESIDAYLGRLRDVIADACRSAA